MAEDSNSCVRTANGLSFGCCSRFKTSVSCGAKVSLPRFGSFSQVAIPLLILPGLMRDCGMKGASIVVVVALALLCSCDRDDQQIKVYKVAKAPLETTPAPEVAMPTNASSPSVLSANAPGLTTSATAEVPKNWEAQPL